MPITISSTLCRDLIDFVGGACWRGPSFELNGAQCHFEWCREDHAYFGAQGPDWEFMVAVPGWYDEELDVPITLLVIGEAHACLQWLPIPQSQKHAIIAHLPITPGDKGLAMLAV